MENKDLVRKSKFLSLVLRHQPDAIGISLDQAGWVSVDTLLSAMKAHGKTLSRAELDEVVRTNNKKRFVFSDDGKKIRANQGHSVDVELGYDPAVPPDFLFHGTASHFVSLIFRDGIVKGKRHHVHLSADKGTATNVGGRHGKPVILAVNAKQMHEEGFQFFKTPNNVWLTDHVPPRFFHRV